VTTDGRQPRTKSAPQRTADALRRHAEELLGRLSTPDSPAPGEAEDIVHELRVHQIELEMQNEELRRTQIDLDAQREKYFELFNRAPVGYLAVHDKGIVGDANLAATRMLRVERRLLLGQPFSAFVLAADRDTYYLHDRKLKQTGEPQACELRLQCLGGNADPVDPGHFWARLESQPQPDASGETLSTWVTFTDITLRKRAEEALSGTMRDLERSNRDLEQFAYVASHDLQEPLRMVASYTELLRKRYQGKLDADADDFIGFAVDGAARMQHLLEDLLDYSRVGTRGKAPEPVSAKTAVDQAIANLGVQIADSKAEVNSGELPMVMADETQLMRVFQNLIGNAIKFHRPDKVPHVEVSSEHAGGLWRFSVADSGIGIGSGDLEHIFEVFTRLNAADEYPGTGIGLAVCRRIVERLGGSIWVESSGEGGTVFCFTLPAVP
jgi:chemotaxis family two-component system sensor kinase Cph1